MSVWENSEYKNWIKQGCPINIEVTQLNLCGHKLKILSNNLHNLPNLKKLDISYNQLTDLPITICKLVTKYYSK